MNKVYTGLDIGENTVKLGVFKEVNGELRLLAKSEVKTRGVSKGKIIDQNKLVRSITIALNNVKDKLGIDIKKVVLSIKPKDVSYSVANTTVNVVDPNMISGTDITNLVKASLKGNIKEGYELITASPVGYRLDNNKIVDNPKGKRSKKLFSKVILASVPRDYLIKYLKVVTEAGLEVIDVTFSVSADYSACGNKVMSKELGAVIDIGEESTTIGIINKGIMINSGTVNIGSRHVDSDISYMLKIGLKDARALKETYALASIRYADKYDSITLKDENGEDVKINQYKITEIVEKRLTEILNSSKKEIKNLTNRKISYIIILGGLSEMTGLNYLASHLLGERVTVWSSTTIGLRHNKYGTLIGTVKYFKDKLNIRSRSLSMIDEEDYERLENTDEENMKKVAEMLND